MCTCACTCWGACICLLALVDFWFADTSLIASRTMREASRQLLSSWWEAEVSENILLSLIGANVLETRSANWNSLFGGSYKLRFCSRMQRTRYSQCPKCRAEISTSGLQVRSCMLGPNICHMGTISWVSNVQNLLSKSKDVYGVCSSAFLWCLPEQVMHRMCILSVSILFIQSDRLEKAVFHFAWIFRLHSGMELEHLWLRSIGKVLNGAKVHLGICFLPLHLGSKPNREAIWNIRGPLSKWATRC